jgi:group I intron endonuclease
MNQYRTLKQQGQRYLFNSFKKHGFENHDFEIIHQFTEDVVQELMDFYEQYYMDYYRALDYMLLNLREAGSNGKFSIDARKNMSIAMKKRGNLREGYVVPPETRKRMSLSHIGKPSGNKGHKMTNEQKHRISISRKGKMCGKDHPNSRKVMHKETGTVYDSIIEASEKLGMNRTTLSAQLNGQNKNTSGVDYFKR